MSRGGLLLRQAADGVELDYVPVAGAVRHGARPPKLPPLGAARCEERQPMRLVVIPRDQDNVVLAVERKEVRLTNLRKMFWPELGPDQRRPAPGTTPTSPAVLLPHITNRAMVMKRYPHGAAGEFFFMKRAPAPRPAWIEICSIDHGSKGIIDFPMIQDRAALLWVINLGCIDLNQWYARCDDVDRPDYLHFDLDPGVGATFDHVRETGVIVQEALDTLKMPSFVKTTGSKGLHVYVPIVRGPEQKQVWTFAKALAQELADAQSGADHGRIPQGQAAERPRAGRLQPEPVGQHAGVDLLGAPASRRHRVDAGDVARGRARRDDRGLHDGERAEAGREGRRSVEAAPRRARAVRPLAFV